MDSTLLPKLDTTKITIKKVEPIIASNIYEDLMGTHQHKIKIDEHYLAYKAGFLDRISFVAIQEKLRIGMITLDFPYPNVAHIYWIGVHQFFCNKHVGKKLLISAEDYCHNKKIANLTVDILSLDKNSELNFNVYTFFKNAGFNPLFERYDYALEQNKIFMQKLLNFNDFIFVDLTHDLSPDVPHWGVDPAFKYNARYVQGNEKAAVGFRVQRLDMAAGIGTHMDAPAHFFQTGQAVHDIPIDALIKPCLVIDVSENVKKDYTITADAIYDFEAENGVIPADSVVIIYTGWDKRWKEPDKYRNEKIFPNLSIEAAELLLVRDIVGIGIDTLSPDAYGSNFPIHQLFLGAGKYIIENVANAKLLDAIGSFVFAFPIKIKEGTEAPMRLVGMKRKIHG